METTKNWLCYLIKSVDTNRTYIGATNNLLRRLNDHCGLNGKSKGAKATKGEMWYVVLYIDGFENKIECLSFEYQFKRMRQKKLDLSQYQLPNTTTIDKRIIDLLKLLILNKPHHKWKKNILTINYLDYNDNKIINLVNGFLK